MPQPLTGLPEHGLVLIGEPTHPTLENRSTRRVIIYVLRSETIHQGQTLFSTNVRNSLQSTRNNVFLAKLGQPAAEPDHSIAPGASQVVEHVGEIGMFPNTEGGTIVSLSLDGVVFEDGEFVGPDNGHSFDNITATIAAERDLHRQVLADRAAGTDPWEKVRTIAATPNDAITGPGAQRLYTMKQRIKAKELLSVIQAPKGGVENAVHLARSSEVYPTIWRRARQ